MVTRKPVSPGYIPPYPTSLPPPPPPSGHIPAHPTSPPPPPPTVEPLIDLQDEIESPAWDEEEPEPILDHPPVYKHVAGDAQEAQQQKNAWQDAVLQDTDEHRQPRSPMPHLENYNHLASDAQEGEQQENAWRNPTLQDAVEHQQPQYSVPDLEKAIHAAQLHDDNAWAPSSATGMQPLENGIIGENGRGIVTESNSYVTPDAYVEGELDTLEEQGPPYPPRPPLEETLPPKQPPRPAIDGNITRSDSSLSSVMKKQKKESYEIRNVNWYDASALKNPRNSPILVQNVNGPCPLLALVNALVLSTPADIDTPLIEALRTREQISLLLLLDAVIDELMSGRRGNDQELPDVIDLHYFLLDLHTGMNVNPRFLPIESMVQGNDIGPERSSKTAGTFEQTKEIALYNTFNIPLIHGWLPAYGSKAYHALQRSAPTYEDVQNIQFRQEELEEKIMNADGLSFQEQGLLEDIITINNFLGESATQLTSYGIDAMSRSLKLGQFAVLFRNNHFSTLYRHPDDHALFSLVTDMGYATHDEVVWESLADINGEQSGLFSGDFRVVTGSSATRRRSSQLSTPPSNDSGWQTVPSRPSRRRQSRQGSRIIEPNMPSPLRQSIADIPTSPSLEQEDHDLALAMQLQDEEDMALERNRERQRRELELSQKFIASENASPQTSSGSPARPGSSSQRADRHAVGGIGGAALRPAVGPSRSSRPSADPEAGVDAPPPSYEQASSLPAYNPPAGTPIHNNGRPASVGRRSTMGRPIRGGGSGLVDRIPSSQQAHTPSGSVSGSNTVYDPKEKDCIVM